MNQNYFLAAQNALYTRYSFLRYMYTLLFEASEFGGTVIRPLFFEFPKDDRTFEIADESFMLGAGLKISPVLYEGVTGNF